MAGRGFNASISTLGIRDAVAQKAIQRLQESCQSLGAENKALRRDLEAAGERARAFFNTRAAALEARLSAVEGIIGQGG